VSRGLAFGAPATMDSCAWIETFPPPGLGLCNTRNWGLWEALTEPNRQGAATQGMTAVDSGRFLTGAVRITRSSTCDAKLVPRRLETYRFAHPCGSSCNVQSGYRAIDNAPVVTNTCS